MTAVLNSHGLTLAGELEIIEMEPDIQELSPGAGTRKPNDKSRSFLIYDGNRSVIPIDGCFIFPGQVMWKLPKGF
jgi:hypothetical protein